MTDINTEIKKDRRLIFEEPLLLSRSLAILIGINEALILQQIHYWLQIAEEGMYNFKDGYYWTYNSINKWQQKEFPFLSASTVKRTFNNLVKAGILVTGSYNKMRGDRSLWYRIDYGRLFIVLLGLHFCRFIEGFDIPLGQNDLMHWVNMTKWQRVNMTPPIPEISLPDNSTENSLGTGSDFQNRPLSFYDFLKIANIETQLEKDHLNAMSYFIKLHERRFGPNRHPKLKPETWQIQLSDLHLVDDDGMLKEVFDDALITMINHYFNKDYQKGCNYCITHFNDPGIKKVNYHEAAY